MLEENLFKMEQQSHNTDYAVFSSEHTKKLLHNKFILIFGDSVQRSAYKDIVLLLQEDRLLYESELKAKGENTFMDDELIFRSELTNKINYREVRQFQTDHFLIRFYFVTRVYSDYMESVLKELESGKLPAPDVIFINSCIWDISRYGKNSFKEYSSKLKTFSDRLDSIVPIETCVVWRTALPVDRNSRSAVNVPDAASKKLHLVAGVYLANYKIYEIAATHRYDLIDVHHALVDLLVRPAEQHVNENERLARREKDGVHWNNRAHRVITFMFLSHISNAWRLGMPGPLVARPVQLEHHYSPDFVQNPYVAPRPRQFPFELAAQQRLSEEERYGGPIGYSRPEYNDHFDPYTNVSNNYAVPGDEAGFFDLSGYDNSYLHSTNYSAYKNRRPLRSRFPRPPVHPPSRTQHYSLQRPPSRMQRPPSRMQRPPLTMQRFPSAMQNRFILDGMQQLPYTDFPSHHVPFNRKVQRSRNQRHKRRPYDMPR